ncbi:MAG: hypothetical protein ACI89R_000334 [Candidatus Azotimanducaceae bacterium]|jgi:hypothetical protein
MVAKNNRQLKANLKLKVFLVFLCLSFVFWMLTKLSKVYKSDIEFSVNYHNLPAKRVIQNDPVKQITSSVKASGFSLLNYKINPKTLEVDIHNLAYKTGSMFYYLPNANLTQLSAQLDVDSSIERVLQDTIFFNLGLNKTKKIPVKFNSDIKYKLGYNLVGNVSIEPDSIEITGPEAILDTINNIRTDKVELLNVSSGFSEVVKLNLIGAEKITYATDQVSVSGNVDKFTEGSFIVSFNIINAPLEYRLTTFPREVKILYQVGLSDYNKVVKENFVIECDYSVSMENNLTYLIPELKEGSTLITSVRIIPNKIEFLIEK